MTTKTQTIKAVFSPTLLHQSDNWILASRDRQRLTTTVTEMRCLKKAAEKVRMDKTRNEVNRRQVNMQPAEQISSLKSFLLQTALSWANAGVLFSDACTGSGVAFETIKLSG